MAAKDSSSNSTETRPQTMAEANLDQFHQFMDMAAKSGQSSLSAAGASGVRASKLAVETTTKTIAYSQAAAAATAEHLMKLAQIRDFKEAADLQAEFIHTRLTAFQDYLQDISKTAEATLIDSASK